MDRPVPLTDVARNWLHREARKPYADFSFDGASADWELVGTLLCQCPFQAAFIWRHHVDWFATELSEEAFLRLRVIEGPPDESWRKLSPDHTITGAAERIDAEELRGRHADIDVDYIRQLAATFGDPATEDRITLYRRDAGRPPSVVDGNHYATAKSLHLLDGGDYVPQPVHLGVRRRCRIRPTGE